MTEKVKNCLDLFSALEKEELITNIQVRTLEQLITITEDEELMDYLYEYKNKNLGIAFPIFLNLNYNGRGGCSILHVHIYIIYSTINHVHVFICTFRFEYHNLQVTYALIHK